MRVKAPNPILIWVSQPTSGGAWVEPGGKLSALSAQLTQVFVGGSITSSKEWIFFISCAADCGTVTMSDLLFQNVSAVS